MELKLIDVASPGACAQFADSLRDTGFAVLKNPIHGLDTLLEKTYSEWAGFFNSHMKHAYDFKKLGGQHGYFPFRSENSKDNPVKDLKEFYHIYGLKDIPGLDKQIRGEMTEVTWDLRNELLSLSETLLMWLDLCGDYDRGTGTLLADMIKGSEQNLLRVIHYPPLVGDEEPGAVRAAAHEDINLITLLPAATRSGLQLLTKEGTWYDVPSEKNSIIVNAGDMLQETTGGYYKSTTHRVVNPEGEEARTSRYSIPLFVHPRPEVRLSEKYTAGEYLTERLRELGLI